MSKFSPAIRMKTFFPNSGKSFHLLLDIFVCQRRQPATVVPSDKLIFLEDVGDCVHQFYPIGFFFVIILMAETKVSEVVYCSRSIDVISSVSVRVDFCNHVS